jgi:hypothetical protein
MGGWMTCSYKSFKRREKEHVEGGEKGRGKWNDFSFWTIHKCLQIDMAKIFKTIKVDHNNFF